MRKSRLPRQIPADSPGQKKVSGGGDDDEEEEEVALLKSVRQFQQSNKAQSREIVGTGASSSSSATAITPLYVHVVAVVLQNSLLYLP